MTPSPQVWGDSRQLLPWGWAAWPCACPAVCSHATRGLGTGPAAPSLLAQAKRKPRYPGVGVTTKSIYQQPTLCCGKHLAHGISFGPQESLIVITIWQIMRSGLKVNVQVLGLIRHGVRV